MGEFPLGWLHAGSGSSQTSSEAPLKVPRKPPCGPLYYSCSVAALLPGGGLRVYDIVSQLPREIQGLEAFADEGRKSEPRQKGLKHLDANNGHPGGKLAGLDFWKFPAT